MKMNQLKDRPMTKNQTAFIRPVDYKKPHSAKHVEFWRDGTRQFDVVVRVTEFAMQLSEAWQKGATQGDIATMIHQKGN